MKDFWMGREDFRFQAYVDRWRGRQLSVTVKPVSMRNAGNLSRRLWKNGTKKRKFWKRPNRL